MKQVLVTILFVLSLVACSGGDKDCALGRDCDSPSISEDVVAWQPGNFQSQASLADNCSSEDGIAEKLFLRSWSNDFYLWYSEIIDKDPAGYTVSSYFDELKTTQRTASGANKDNYHFWLTTADYENSSSGQSYGYGIEWEFVSLTGDRTIKVRYLEPTQASALSAIARGDELVEIDTTSIDTTTSEGVDFLNTALFSPRPNQQHNFRFKRADASEYTVSLTSGNYVYSAVHTSKVLTYSSSRKLGYLLFNSFIGVAEKPLIDAFTKFQQANVDELVLDLRYNGGGLLWLASQLAYMIAGDASVGKVFEVSEFNAKHPTVNPITLSAITAMPFYPSGIGFNNDVAAGVALPKLNLSRIYILTSQDTCSASEAIINSLRGIDVEVVLVGDTTCGKPYGFYPQDNCGNTYFSIQFKGVNHKGFGEYTDGFTPRNSSDFTAEKVVGCSVLDTMSEELGDESEVLLEQAISLMEGGSCSATPVSMIPMARLHAISSDAGTGGVKEEPISPFTLPVSFPGRVLTRP